MAAPPLRTVSAGGRALGIFLAVIAVVVVAALVYPAIRGDDETPGVTNPDGETPTTTSLTATTQAPLEEITPISISCSSEYNSNLGCDNLIDGEDTYWNDQSLRGEDARITVTFVNPVALEQVQIINVANEEKFRRNYRVKAVEIYADDLPGVPFVGDLSDTNNRPHAIETDTSHTLELEIRVTSTWSSEAVAGNQAFDELAIQEIKFWGRVQSSTPLENTTTTSG